MCGKSAHNRLTVHPAVVSGENTVFAPKIPDYSSLTAKYLVIRRASTSGLLLNRSRLLAELDPKSECATIGTAIPRSRVAGL